MADDGHSATGRSIIEMLWEQADILYSQLMDLKLDEETWPADRITKTTMTKPRAEEVAAYWELRGKLGGLTYALAKMLHTYEPTKEAMDKIKGLLQQRWEDAEAEDE